TRHRVTGKAITHRAGRRFAWKSSILRQIKIAAAGINGRTDRAFTVQFRKATKINVPTTHSPRRIDSASRRRQASVTVKASVTIPPATKGTSFTASHVLSGGGSRPGHAIAIELGTARRNAPAIHRQRKMSGTISKAASIHPPVKLSPVRNGTIREEAA